jgi:hypothetical protein
MESLGEDTKPEKGFNIKAFSELSPIVGGPWVTGNYTFLIFGLFLSARGGGLIALVTISSSVTGGSILL